MGLCVGACDANVLRVGVKWGWVMEQGWVMEMVMWVCVLENRGECVERMCKVELGKGVG